MEKIYSFNNQDGAVWVCTAKSAYDAMDKFRHSGYNVDLDDEEYVKVYGELSWEDFKPLDPNGDYVWF